MNKIWQSIAIATATIAIGTSNVSATPSRVVGDRATAPTGNIAQRNTSCSNLTFSNGGVVHQGKLRLDANGNGRMQVRYFSVERNRTEVIDEDMTSQNSEHGLIVAGSHPVYAGTNTKTNDYSPDNLLLKIQENGARTFFLFDLKGVTSQVTATPCQ